MSIVLVYLGLTCSVRDATDGARMKKRNRNETDKAERRE